MNLFKKLEELSLPLGEYVVVGSGLLAALGLREANDLDLAVSETLLKKLIDSGNFKQEIRDDLLFLVAEDVEVLSKLNWPQYPTTANEAIRTATMIKGFPFLNMEETIKFKTALSREKDFRDIKLLQEYSSTL